VHAGIGNLGTFSYAECSRVVAEFLNVAWENVTIERGDTRKGTPWNNGQFGSNTTFTHSRAYYVAAMDAKAKLLEIAAKDLGGAPADYDLDAEKVVHKTDRAKSMTYAQAATRAIALGGKFAGQEVPGDINDITKEAVKVVAGKGLVGVAKDTLPGAGTVPGLCTAAIQVEVDMETGHVEIVDYLGVADCGQVMSPKGFSGQITGGAVMGFGLAMSERYVYDPQNGFPLNRGFHDGHLPTYLDVPVKMDAAAIEKKDPQNPVGSRGIGEPAQGCAAAALLCAISDALGGKLFNRTPVTADMVLNVAAGRPQSSKPLQQHTQ
jgi:CO/xanthine dehydrogenase Mo-binding subunit